MDRFLLCPVMFFTGLESDVGLFLVKILYLLPVANHSIRPTVVHFSTPPNSFMILWTTSRGLFVSAKFLAASCVLCQVRTPSDFVLLTFL